VSSHAEEMKKKTSLIHPQLLIANNQQQLDPLRGPGHRDGAPGSRGIIKYLFKGPGFVPLKHKTNV